MNKLILSTIFYLGVTSQSTAQSDLSTYSEEIFNTYGCATIETPLAATPCLRVLDLKAHVIPKGYKNPFFWEVLNNDDQVVAYLLGTTHRPLQYIKTSDFPDEMIELFESIDTVFMEAGPNGTNQVEGLWRELYDSPNNNSPLIDNLPLQNRISADWKKFSNILLEELETCRIWIDVGGASNLRNYFTDNMSPLALNIEFFRMATRACVTASQDILDYSLRQFFMDSRTKPIIPIELETPLEQLSIIQHYVSYENFLSAIEAPGNIFWNLRKIDTQSYIKYLEGDLDYFEAMASNMEEWEYEALIGARNDIWYQKLKPVIDKTKEPVLVFVGSLHFNGPKSLLKKFKKDGFKINRKSF